MQGADCFRDYMREVSSSPDYILGGFLLVLHFRSKPKLEFFNFLFAGRSSEFETADIYRENIQNYRKLWWEIVEDIDLKSQKFDYFIIFYQIYRAFRANKYLSNFLEGEQGTKTKEKIVGFVSNIFE